MNSEKSPSRKLQSKIYQKDIYKKKSLLLLELEYNETSGSKINSDLQPIFLSKEKIEEMKRLRSQKSLKNG